MSHTFKPDRFGIGFISPVGNTIDAAEAERIFKLAEATRLSKEEAAKPQERPIKQLQKLKEQL